MTQTSMQQLRRWRGPAIFTYGFRPFFLGAAAWAVLAMLLWLAMLAGHDVLPIALDPVSWHAHEFLFGYLGAVIAGFLLTAVPNWTGRFPVVGWPLAGLAGLWLAGRLAMAVSADLPALAVAIADLVFPVALAAVIAREIVAGRNWRNLVVLAMLAVFATGNAVFHWEAAQGGFAASGAGLRLALAAAILMIAVIGGRIVPSFTRNWLVKHAPGRLPVPPMQTLDKAALFVLVAALLAWVALPESPLTAALLALAVGAHLLRLARWCGHRTLAEPLVAVLHLGYLFLPLGALTLATEILWSGTFGGAAAQHVWMAGATGLMTLAVMTRATLGHTGQPLTAGAGTVAVYAALVLAVLARLGAGLWPQHAGWLHTVSGAAWIGAFGGFCLVYGPLLARPKPASRG
ncbi:NnrS family protein [Maliponia aquimaris]|uniref:NnrS protein n=1 Tax=Maliponia aquimaris TaxID=1673631 RepID=A0A238L7H6_9RHOB|nr:NnrS family protein [Maliponia aquimaris]SMX50801.1 NnrS protein [Maliponia aquimaris]